jgi:hypothetical protein
MGFSTDGIEQSCQLVILKLETPCVLYFVLNIQATERKDQYAAGPRTVFKSPSAVRRAGRARCYPTL